MSQPYPDEPGWWGGYFEPEVAKRYAQAGEPYPNAGSYRWHGRTAYDIGAGMTKEESARVHLAELDAELGLTPAPTPIPPPSDSLMKGYLRLYGRSFGDDSGPRIIHGATCFPLLCQWRDNPEEAIRQLDRTAAAGQMYLRVGWRINGRPWNSVSPELTIDPIKEPRFESILWDVLSSAWERGVRIMLTCCDMYNWSDADAERWFARVADVARAVNSLVVCCNDGLNEMRGTHPDGESDAAVQQMEHLMTLARHAYEWGQFGISDPGSQDRDGMKRMSGGPATIAQIHDVRWHANDAIRRAFNTAYEGYSGKPIHQREPTGPNSPGSHPNGQVYQPTNEPTNLLAIYTMHVITGQMSTYFSDPALINRAPLDSTWGFRELPALWRTFEIPADIGQGTLKPGHYGDAPLQVVGSNAERADSMVAPGGTVAFGVISGGSNWRVKSGWDAAVTFCHVGGLEDRGRVSAGQVIETGARGEPLVVRLVR